MRLLLDTMATANVLAKSGSEYQSISSEGPPTVMILFFIVVLLPTMYTALTSLVVFVIILLFCRVQFEL